MGPILDMMAVLLENIPNSNIVARATMFSIYRTAQIISSLPNVAYHRKVKYYVYIECSLQSVYRNFI